MEDVDYIIKTIKEDKQMASLKEEAKEYETKQTKNIAELDKVDVSLNLENREGVDDKGTPYKYKVIVLNSVDYRVPWKVISDLKAILQAKPDLEYIKVHREGQGMNTKYTVIPL